MVGGLVNSKLSALVVNEKYQQLSDDEKSDFITKFTDKAKIRGRADFILEQTQELSGDELKQLLSVYKEEKLMTKQVFKEYMKLRSGQ